MFVKDIDIINVSSQLFTLVNDKKFAVREWTLPLFTKNFRFVDGTFPGPIYI